MADISFYIHTDLVELLSTDPDPDPDPDPYFDLGLGFSQFESTLDPDDVDVHTCVFSLYCNVDDDITDNADFYLDPNFNEIDISRMGWDENENEDIQQFDSDFNSVSDEIDIGDISGIGWDENEDIRQFDADFNSVSDEIDIGDISRMGWDENENENEDIQLFDTVFDDEIDIGDISSSVQIRWGENEEGDDEQWEEVVDDDERQVFNVSVSMEIPSEELIIAARGWYDVNPVTEDHVITNLEWEFLLNLQPNADDEVDNDEFEILVGGEIRRPPASKVAVESLAVVVVTKDDLEDGLLCAVCKEDMGIGEEVKLLPCSHRYHVACIDPWLGIRNTCPVCRFELPTDDPEYERRRSERGAPA